MINPPLHRRRWLGQRRGGPPPIGSFAGFHPTQLSGLVLWLRADLGITLGGTLLLTGTSPAPVTITGTANPTPGLRLTIDLGGARGVATFKASADNGASFFATGILTAASVPLTGPLTGITVAFPVGTYVLNDTYDGVVSQWNDQSGNGNHFANATAATQPDYIVSGLNSRNVVRGGRSTTVTLTNAGVTAGTQGSYYLVASKSSSANRYLLTGSSNNAAFLTNFGGVGFEWLNSPDRYTLSATPSAGLHVLAVTQINGGALIGYCDGVLAFTQTATVVLSTTKAITSDDTPSVSAVSDFGEHLQYTVAHTPGQVLTVSRYLGAHNNVAVA